MHIAAASVTSKTGLTTWLRLLGEYLAEARAKEQRFGLVVVELGELRRINTSLGYEVGREVLVEAAQRLDSLRRPQDRVVQFADSAFAVVLPGIRNQGHALLAVSKILRAMSEPFETSVRRLAAGPAVGIALFPEHAVDAAPLMQCAETALVTAASSRESWCLYAPERTGEIAKHLGLENDLDSALQSGELQLWYQPKIDLREGQAFGAEALMRWIHPDRGFIPPDIFIEVADETGQIYELTWFAINTALRQLRGWSSADADFHVAVNATPNIVQHEDLAPIISDALGLWSIEPDCLVIEVTESALMRDREASFRNLRALRELGVRVAIDDFGTGYSSLAYFKNIPATELKIDKSFVMNMLEDPADAQIVRAVVDLAHAFDLEVIAEGVENAETAEALRTMGCDAVQGYFYSKPLPDTEFQSWLSAQRRA